LFDWQLALPELRMVAIDSGGVLDKTVANMPKVITLDTLKSCEVSQSHPRRTELAKDGTLRENRRRTNGQEA
jgi:hypothetical protein